MLKNVIKKIEGYVRYHTVIVFTAHPISRQQYSSLERDSGFFCT